MLLLPTYPGGLGVGYGKDGKPAPDGILFIDSAPHDWLFQHVSAVVHHGGAGTTAAGLYAGRQGVCARV